LHALSTRHSADETLPEATHSHSVQHTHASANVSLASSLSWYFVGMLHFWPKPSACRCPGLILQTVLNRNIQNLFELQSLVLDLEVTLKKLHHRHVKWHAWCRHEGGERTRDAGCIAWRRLLKIWQDCVAPSPALKDNTSRMRVLLVRAGGVLS
jgi:hypothetical protein